MLRLLLVCACASAGAAWANGDVVLHKLPGDAPAEDVLSGRLDHLLEKQPSGLMVGGGGTADWWRITTTTPLPSDGQPTIVLRRPLLEQVEAWVPGRDQPTRHALYGEHANVEHSSRVLLVDLPEGMPAGTAAWLRIESVSTMRVRMSIEPRAEVHRDDLVFVAWRSFVLSVLLVLSLLAIPFRIGTGDSSFAWFGGMLFMAVLYMISVGGDARLLPGADYVFGESSRAHRFVGGLGVVFSNQFQRQYLDLRTRMPRFDALLWVGTALAAAGAFGSIFSDSRVMAHLGNSGLILSATLLLVGSTRLALRGDRVGRMVMVSWLPLMVFTLLVAADMMSLRIGPAWLAEGLAASFALAGLLLMIGLAEKLLQLRRDRDHASARASSDELTGLLNRSGLEGELHRVMQLAEADGVPMSIAFVDVDHFKAINDEHGHRVGDQCLRVVSMRVRNQLRTGDILGRYGGDEFLVVLPGSRLREALAVSERMLAAVNSRPLSIDDVRLQGTLSIGVAEYIRGESAESLIERADAALYASKQGGRNRVTGCSRRHLETAPA